MPLCTCKHNEAIKYDNQMNEFFLALMLGMARRQCTENYFHDDQIKMKGQKIVNLSDLA